MFSYIFMKILESRPQRYDWGIDFLTKGQAGKIKEHIVTCFVRPGMAVLDVGCGTGDLAVRAARTGAMVAGVDISTGMLAVAQQRVKKNGLGDQVVLHRAGVVEIDSLFEDNSFDLVTSTHVMSELYAAERQWALKELFRILKPDGKLVVVSEVRPQQFLKRAVYYALRFPLALITYLVSQTGTKPLQNLAAEMRQAGFEITEKRYSFIGSLLTVVAKKSKAAQPEAAAPILPPDQDRSPIKSLFDFCGRWFPNPVVPGLRRIGDPDRHSPVLVSGNFHLTVRRVERAMAGRSCYLLVVQSKGINVWCASAGEAMNTHSIITALKISAIASLVDHRQLILPQLSAAGIDTKLLQKASGWQGKWGPVYAGSLPEFIAGGRTKTRDQCRVHFDLPFRMEMLFAMNFLLWLFFGGIALAIDPVWALVMTLVFWGAGFILYAGYDLLPFKGGWSKALLSAIAAVAVWGGISNYTAGSPWYYKGWMIFAALVILSIGFDLKGIVGDQTSEAEALLHKLGFESLGHLFRSKGVHTGFIAQDKSRCVNCNTCGRVCPVGVFGMAEVKKNIIIVDESACLKCNGCVMQCPQKALSLICNPRQQGLRPALRTRFSLSNKLYTILPDPEKLAMGNLFKKIIKSNILKDRLLRNIFFLSMILVTILPLYNYLVIRPSFEKFLTESTNDEAVKIAKHAVTMLLPKNAELNKKTISQNVSGQIERLKRDFRLTKLKIFSKYGEIIFSSDPEEIGNFNNQKYFHEIVAKGKVITKDIQKKTKSLDGQLVPVDVVETYVPLMSDGIFQGAVEIYYDLTARKQQLDELLSRSSAVVFIIASGLFLSIIVILIIENKSIYKRKQAEKEREKLITELQDAAARIKTLNGLLPICSNCKNIRDDKGYWKQIESYIRDHSEAEFTHSLCPNCAKKLYPEFFEE